MVPPAAAKPRSGVTSLDFAGKPAGARQIGLGEIGAPLEGSPQSPVWNPAGLHYLAGPAFSADVDVARQSNIAEAVLLQAEPLRGRKLAYLGFAAADGAFFYRPLASFSTHTVTDPANPLNNFREEALKVSQFGFSASQEGEKGTAVGVTISYLNARRGLAEASSAAPPTLELADGNGFSLDVGFHGRKGQAAYGLAFFNIPGMLYWNRYKTDQLPVIIRGGGSFHPVKLFGVYAEYEKRFNRGGLPRPSFTHFGAEIAPLPWLQLRTGIFGEDLNDSNKTAYAAGFSVASPQGHRVDLAVKTYRVLDERVDQYFASIVLPLPKTGEAK